MATQKYKNEKYKSRINGKHTASYNAWCTMKQRCSDIKLHTKHPSYRDCVVSEGWLDFQNFAEWFEDNYIEGYQLDKDLLVPGNKLYSADTCCFIPQEINLAIIKPHKKRDLPTGVYTHHSDNNKFVAHIRENKVTKYLAIFDSPENAFDCYKKAKEHQLLNLAIKYKNTINKEVYNALANYTIKN